MPTFSMDWSIMGKFVASIERPKAKWYNFGGETLAHWLSDQGL